MLLERHLSRGDYRRPGSEAAARRARRGSKARARDGDVEDGRRGAARSACSLFALAYLAADAPSGKGFEMDEGAVVAYPARVLDGAVPHRDFLTFYGPGNLWLVAGAFAVFGESVGTERAVGLAVPASSSSCRCS